MQADFSAGVYIAAELDNQTNMEAIVHREVPGRETSFFVALFKHVTWVYYDVIVLINTKTWFIVKSLDLIGFRSGFIQCDISSV